MATIPGYELYGGATITRVVDGAGAEWIGCCAKQSSNQKFGFYLFKNGVNIPLTPFCNARGSISPQGHWVAWNGAEYHTGPIPGFTPIPAGDTSALEARIAALEEQLAALPPTTTAYPLYIPSQPGMPIEGGELQLADGAGGVWAIDCRDGNLRFLHNGVLIVQNGVVV